MSTPEDDKQVPLADLADELDQARSRVASLEHQLQKALSDRPAHQTEELDRMRQELAELGSMRDAALAANRAKSNFLA
ncbi:MAG: hypothetical protein ACPG4T_24905, partial [Nannocystaceae bacterium]